MNVRQRLTLSNNHNYQIMQKPKMTPRQMYDLAKEAIELSSDRDSLVLDNLHILQTEEHCAAGGCIRGYHSSGYCFDLYRSWEYDIDEEVPEGHDVDEEGCEYFIYSDFEGFKECTLEKLREIIIPVAVYVEEMGIVLKTKSI